MQAPRRLDQAQHRADRQLSKDKFRPGSALTEKERPIDLGYDTAGTTIASTTLTYLHSDHLNTPRLATNQGGNLVWSWQSDAFGVGQPNTYGGNIDVILRFPGQIADAHSALYYNYFRDYDPETGRYVESDPIGLDGGLNTYGYVEGNPINAIDAYGLSTLTSAGRVAGAAAAGALGGTANTESGHTSPTYEGTELSGRSRPTRAEASSRGRESRSSGILSSSATKFSWRRCNDEETNACKAYCESTGRQMMTCMSRMKRGPGIKNGEIIPSLGKLSDSMSCSCDDNSCPI